MIRSLDPQEQLLVLTHNYIGQLGYEQHQQPFVVQITYFYDSEENTIIGYSGPGHKINALRKNPNVCLAVSDIDSVNEWKSVLVHGTFEELSGSTAKAWLHKFSLGVKDLIMRKEKRSLDFINQFSSKIYKDEIPIVFTIKIHKMTGRMRKF